MGYGSTGVAALAEGRRFIGMEKDPAIFAQAEARLKGL
jgi:DNA modification methylase